MSHMRDIADRIRAAIAVVAVWSLMFSVSLSGAATASATDIVVKNNIPVAGGLFACFKRHMTQRADAAGEKTPEGDHAGKHRCPCCLAASVTATAVLPERLAAIARAEPAQAPVFYLAAQGDAPKSASSRSINGARAPPSLI